MKRESGFILPRSTRAKYREMRKPSVDKRKRAALVKEKDVMHGVVCSERTNLLILMGGSQLRVVFGVPHRYIVAE